MRKMLGVAALLTVSGGIIGTGPASAQYVYNRGAQTSRPIPFQQYRPAPTLRVAPAPGRVQMYSNVYAGRALYGMRNVRPGVAGVGTIYYQGVRGYSVSGWEVGRMQSIRRYGTDPGPWPGWRGALGW